MHAQPTHRLDNSESIARALAERAFSRASGAPLVGGNAVELLIDARANFDAWLGAIRAAQHSILLENYIFRADDIGHEFVAALADRAAAGVRVHVIRDWLGCLGLSGDALWQPLTDAGGEVRVFNPPRLTSMFGWMSRDHRKLLVVDGNYGSISGVCVSGKWLGDEANGIPPWRDTGIAIRGPAVCDLASAFADNWALLGKPLPETVMESCDTDTRCGEVDLRVVATVPNRGGLYRLDQLIAAMARQSLWLTDAYFVGVAPYVQALAAAAKDEVDVRLLVPGSSDIPSVGALSRSGYRPLLKAGVRVFEWNGSMLHAKTAVADGRWARIGSSNLNLASWIGNCELDVAIEDEETAQQMEVQYQRDLANSTEIVLGKRLGVSRDKTTPRLPHIHSRKGSSSRAAAGALRLANTFSSAIANRRVIGSEDSAWLLYGGLALIAFGTMVILWPRILAWPLALLALWYSATMIARWFALRKRKNRSE